MLSTMQNILSVLLIVLLSGLMGCENKPVSPEENPVVHSAGTPLPGGLKDGTWFWGNSGPMSYYDHDGNDVGSATEAGRQYRFTEVNGQGRLEFEQYLGMRNASSCVTEIYTRKSGTVRFERAGTFTFYPLNGSFKTVKSGRYSSCAKETSERKASGEDLLPVTLRYQLKPVDGETLLYIYNESDVHHANPLFVYQKLP
jgi:hypothetical protein